MSNMPILSSFLKFSRTNIFLQLFFVFIAILCFPTKNLFASAPTMQTKETKPNYYLAVEPLILPDGQIKLQITTNILGTIEVMTALSLHGQADKDIWIGKDDRVQLNNGSGFTIFNTNDLPKGKYDAEVSFYPKWGFKDSISRSSGISQNIETSKTIMLPGSSVSPAVVLSKISNKEEIIQKTKNLYLELIKFKDNPDFHVFGFAIGGPYNDWLKKVELLEQAPNSNSLLEEGLVVGDLKMLGLEYMKSKGKKTEYTRFIVPVIKKALRIK